MLGWHCSLHEHFLRDPRMFEVTLHLKHCAFCLVVFFFFPNRFSEKEEVLRASLEMNDHIIICSGGKWFPSSGINLRGCCLRNKKCFVILFPGQPFRVSNLLSSTHTF